ncbi:MAG: hypothetical protein KA155_01525 [Alphaproteobacteria bacterium]|jgi:hypothetical protein|nr:hypothetical protein [Alphaproteobacteria bacterium]
MNIKNFSENVLILLKENISSQILSQILFLDDWEEPENFVQMTIKSRMALMWEYAETATVPTKGNNWVWFGSYLRPRFHPIYNRKLVARVLFEALNKLHPWPLPIERKRLVSNFTDCRSNVNPFKFFPGTGDRYPDSTLSYRRSCNVATAQEVHAAIDDMKRGLYIGFNDNEAKMKECLLLLKHSHAAIEKALPHLADIIANFNEEEITYE